MHSPVYKENREETVKATDTTEIVKRLQSLHGKVEGWKNEIKQLSIRISKLEGLKENSSEKILEDK